jgi:hypothetical protein
VRRIVSLATVFAVFAALLHAGPQQAWACYCDGRQLTLDDVSTVYDESQVLAVVRTDESSHAGTVLTVEQGLKGVDREQLTFERGALSSCHYPHLNQAPRHFIAIHQDDPDLFPSYCTSFPLSGDQLTGWPMEERLDDFIGAMEREAAARGTLWRPGEDDRTSHLVVIAYVAGSVAALVALIRVGWRSSRHI